MGHTAVFQITLIGILLSLYKVLWDHLPTRLALASLTYGNNDFIKLKSERREKRGQKSRYRCRVIKEGESCSFSSDINRDNVLKVWNKILHGGATRSTPYNAPFIGYKWNGGRSHNNANVGTVELSYSTYSIEIVFETWRLLEVNKLAQFVGKKTCCYLYNALDYLGGQLNYVIVWMLKQFFSRQTTKAYSLSSAVLCRMKHVQKDRSFI